MEPSSQRGRRSQSRSVWGCLTCRRRKVKCQARRIPCDACHRLQLTCTPSFHSNFKQWKKHEFVPTETRGTSENPSPDASPSQQQNHPGSPGIRTPSDTSDNLGGSPIGLVNDANDQSLVDDLTVAADWDFSHPWNRFATVLPEGLVTSDELSASYHRLADFNDGLFDGVIENITEDAPIEGSMDATQSAYPSPNYPGSDPNFSNQSLLSLMTNTDWLSIWQSPSLIHSPTSRPDDTPKLIDYYKRNLSTFWSSVPTAWSFYGYAIKSTENILDSPLRHSILAWSSAHLVVKGERAFADLQMQHYARASSIVDSLVDAVQETTLVPPSTTSLNMNLRMLLSTSLFLCYSDLVSGDTRALADRLSRIEAMLETHWTQLEKALGSLELRILLWLAYVHLRTNMWGRITPLLPTTDQAPSQSSRRMETHDLWDLLMKKKGPADMRWASGKGYYLTDCYGSSLPKERLEECLQLEPYKRTSDDAMGLYSTIRDFEIWEKEMQSRNMVDQSLVEELRTAKIEAIKANIARIQSELKMIHAERLQSASAPESVELTNFQFLVTSTVCLSATILLNRATAPNIRSDAETQAIAVEIVRIVWRVRKTGYLLSPRTLVWPLPIFIAGIEVTDEIYLDWIEDYMRELANQGSSTKKAVELLRRVNAKQDLEGKRVKVCDVMREFNELVTI